MNKTIKSIWLKALRSGNYKQGKNKLKINKKDGTQTYCCLGVLANEMCKAGLCTKQEAFGPRNNQSLLTNTVIQWAGFSGFESDNPIVNRHALSSHNDGDGQDCPPKTFKQIANLIQRYL